MNKPSTSFIVVIKGPVANAGSILCFFKVSGINVPKSAANIMTASKEILTVMLNSMLYPSPNAAPKIITEQIIPFNNHIPSSFINF